jgi:hypothetical protein
MIWLKAKLHHATKFGIRNFLICFFLQFPQGAFAGSLPLFSDSAGKFPMFLPYIEEKQILVPLRDHDKSVRNGTEMCGNRFFLASVESGKDIATLVHYDWIREHDVLAPAIATILATSS